ncbi:hypothetical protein FOZ61_003462 [Perkinsus olseni]|nr:hypothetical protein FOZ61_003462 [Perkinsus olseni]
MDRSNLIVNYLPTKMEEDALFAMFEPFGPIQSVKIVRERHTGSSMGFGFVNYRDNESARRAMGAVNGREIECGPNEGDNGKKRIKVSVGRPAWKANIHSNLFVSGIPVNFTEEHIKDVLFGPEFSDRIESVRMLRETSADSSQGDARFRGIAVIRFDTEGTASEIIRRFHGIQVVPGEKETTLHIKPWRPECRNLPKKGLLPGPAPFQLSCMTQFAASQLAPVAFEQLAATPGHESPERKPSPKGEDVTAFEPVIFNSARQEALAKHLKEHPGIMLSSLVIGPDATWSSAMFRTKRDALNAIRKLNGLRMGGYFLRMQLLPDSLQPPGVLTAISSAKTETKRPPPVRTFKTNLSFTRNKQRTSWGSGLRSSALYVSLAPIQTRRNEPGYTEGMGVLEAQRDLKDRSL